MKHEPIELFPGCFMRDMTKYDIDAVYDIESKHPTPGQPVCPKSIMAIRLEMPAYWNWVVCMGEHVVFFGVIRFNGKVCDCLKLASSYDKGMLFPHVARVLKAPLKKMGCDSVVGRCSEELWPLYQRQGFVREGAIPNFFGNGKDAVALRYIL